MHRLHTEIQPHGGAKGLVERRDARRHLADRVDDILQHSEAFLGTETDLHAAVSDICREAIERAETYGEYRRNYLTVHSMNCSASKQSGQHVLGALHVRLCFLRSHPLEPHRQSPKLGIPESAHRASYWQCPTGCLSH